MDRIILYNLARSCATILENIDGRRTEHSRTKETFCISLALSGSVKQS